MTDSELEQSLRALRPAAPSSALEERLAQALAEPLPRPSRPVIWPAPVSAFWPRLFGGLPWALAGAAAGVAGMLLFQPFASSPAPQTLAARPPAAAGSVFEPAEAAREVLSTEEASSLESDTEEPARLVRTTSIERHRWTNPTTGARLLVEVPREDLVAETLSYQ